MDPMAIRSKGALFFVARFAKARHGECKDCIVLLKHVCKKVRTNNGYGVRATGFGQELKVRDLWGSTKHHVQGLIAECHATQQIHGTNRT
jgi:hypothetical protein